MPTRERRLQEEQKRLEKGLPRKKGPPRRLGVRYVSTLQLDVITSECLKIAAWQRHVSMASIISDILGLWVSAACDFSQDIYKSRLPVGVHPMAVPERWQGYLASLGFKKALQAQARSFAIEQEEGIMQDDAADPPQARHAVPPPVEQQEVSPEIVAPPPPPATPAQEPLPEMIPPLRQEQLTPGSPFQAPLHHLAQPRPGDVPVKPAPAIAGFEPPGDEELRREPPPGAEDFPLPMSGQHAPRKQDPL